MNTYYTTINLENNQFVGAVFNPNTNQEIFKTRPHNSQLQAVQEINNFLQNKTAKDIPPQQPIQITNTIKPVIIPGVKSNSTGRRCCGR